MLLVSRCAITAVAHSKKKVRLQATLFRQAAILKFDPELALFHKCLTGPEDLELTRDIASPMFKVKLKFLFPSSFEFSLSGHSLRFVSLLHVRTRTKRKTPRIRLSALRVILLAQNLIIIASQTPPNPILLKYQNDFTFHQLIPIGFEGACRARKFSLVGPYLFFLTVQAP